MMFRLGFIAWILTASCLTYADDSALQEVNLDNPIVVSVKSLAPAQRSEPVMAPPAMAVSSEPTATLPGQRVPQYKTGISQTNIDSVDNEGNIAFVIASTQILEAFGRPLFVRVKPTIDGQTLTDRRASLNRELRDVAQTRINTVSDESPNQESNSVVNADQTTAGADRVEDADADVQARPNVEYNLSLEPTEIAQRYAAATGESLTEDDSTWLLNHWTSGPVVLSLRDYFQSFRALANPVCQILDRNSDQVLSKQELQAAPELLGRCDADRNDIVDVLEIESAAATLSKRDDTMPSGGAFLFLPGELIGITANDTIRFPLVQSLDQNADGRVDQNEADLLADQNADAVLSVDFDSDPSGASQLSLLSVSSTFRSHCGEAELTDGIELLHPDLTLCFSAVQVFDGDQVSLGVVEDGYPLLPLLDPNDDGRLTIRERRELTKRLQSLDANDDGQLEASEMTAPLRVCIGRGPTVHRELALVRSVKQVELEANQSNGAPGLAPEWFARMDRNEDRDLSRPEFPGDDQQFDAMDQDKDGLIDAAEAMRFDRQSQDTKADDTGSSDTDSQ